MSRRKLQDQVRTLYEELKRKDVLIEDLKEKLIVQRRKTTAIRLLTLQISNLCEQTIGSRTKGYEIDRKTRGVSIDVHNIYERVSSSDKVSDDEPLKQETPEETTSGGNEKTSQGSVMDDPQVARRSVYSSEGDHYGLEKERESAEQQLKYINQKFLKDHRWSAPARRSKGWKPKLEPPERKPYVKDLQDWQPDDSVSAEVIFAPRSLDESISIQRLPDRLGEPMAQLSNDSYEHFSGATIERRNNPSMSLSSMDKVLPSIPSPTSISAPPTSFIIPFSLAKLGSRESSGTTIKTNVFAEGVRSPRLKSVVEGSGGV